MLCGATGAFQTANPWNVSVSLALRKSVLKVAASRPSLVASSIACRLSKSSNISVALVYGVVEEHTGLVQSASRTTRQSDGTACDRRRAPFAIGTHWLCVRTGGVTNQV